MTARKVHRSGGSKIATGSFGSIAGPRQRPLTGIGFFWFWRSEAARGVTGRFQSSAVVQPAGANDSNWTTRWVRVRVKRTMAPTRSAVVGKLGCVSFSAWIFSSQLRPNARLGGFLPTSVAGW